MMIAIVVRHDGDDRRRETAEDLVAARVPIDDLTIIIRAAP